MILAVLAILAVFAAIWLFVKVEHIAARIVGFFLTLGGCVYLAYLFLTGRL